MWNDLYTVNKKASYANHSPSLKTNPNEDILSEIYSRVEHMTHLRQEELAILHPQAKQGLFLKNTGVLDLFAQNDTGVRIDPRNQSVQTFSNVNNMHTYTKNEWIKGHATSNVTGKQKMKVGDLDIEVKNNLIIVNDKSISVTIGQGMNLVVNGNADIKINGNSTTRIKGNAIMNVNGTTNITSQGDLTLSSEKALRLKANDLHFIAKNVSNSSCGIAPRYIT